MRTSTKNIVQEAASTSLGAQTTAAAAEKQNTTAAELYASAEALDKLAKKLLQSITLFKLT